MLNALNTDDWDRAAWCGPSVIATLTGCSVAEATNIIARMQGKAAEKVVGTYHEQMIHALHMMGYSVREVDLVERYGDRVTVGRYLSERPVMERAFPVLLSMSSGDTAHVGAAHYDHYCDNWTKVPVNITAMPKPKRFLWNVWVVRKNA